MSIDSFTIRHDNETINYPIKLKIEKILPDDNFFIEKNPAILYADFNTINFPLTIRKWEKGDWFIPFGMKGKKKVSDYFTDNKFNLFDKEDTWLLCSGGDNIVWIVGERADDRFKITKNTTEILKITMY